MPPCASGDRAAAVPPFIVTAAPATAAPLVSTTRPLAGFVGCCVRRPAPRRRPGSTAAANSSINSVMHRLRSPDGVIENGLR